MWAKMGGHDGWGDVRGGGQDPLSGLLHGLHVYEFGMTQGAPGEVGLS